MLKLLLKNRLNIILLGFTRDELKSRVGRIIGTTVGAAIFSLILFYSIKLFSLIYNRLDMELADLILNISLDYIFAIIFVVIILDKIKEIWPDKNENYGFVLLYIHTDIIGAV